MKTRVSDGFQLPSCENVNWRKRWKRFEPANTRNLLKITRPLFNSGSGDGSTCQLEVISSKLTTRVRFTPVNVVDAYT